MPSPGTGSASGLDPEALQPPEATDGVPPEEAVDAASRPGEDRADEHDDQAVAEHLHGAVTATGRCEAGARVDLFLRALGRRGVDGGDRRGVADVGRLVRQGAHLAGALDGVDLRDETGLALVAGDGVVHRQHELHPGRRPVGGVDLGGVTADAEVPERPVVVVPFRRPVVGDVRRSVRLTGDVERDRPGLDVAAGVAGRLVHGTRDRRGGGAAADRPDDDVLGAVRAVVTPVVPRGDGVNRAAGEVPLVVGRHLQREGAGLLTRDHCHHRAHRLTVEGRRHVHHEVRPIGRLVVELLGADGHLVRGCALGRTGTGPEGPGAAGHLGGNVDGGNGHGCTHEECRAEPRNAGVVHGIAFR